MMPHPLEPGLRERDGQAAQLLQQPTPSRERVGGSLRDAQIMGTAAVGVAQKEDREEGLDQQDIFDGVVFLLPALTRLLFNRVLGADDASLGAVMGKIFSTQISLELFILLQGSCCH